MGRFHCAITLSLNTEVQKNLKFNTHTQYETIIITISSLKTSIQCRPVNSYACFLTPKLKYALLTLPKYELGKVRPVVIVIEQCFKTKHVWLNKSNKMQ